MADATGVSWKARPSMSRQCGRARLAPRAARPPGGAGKRAHVFSPWRGFRHFLVMPPVTLEQRLPVAVRRRAQPCTLADGAAEEMRCWNIPSALRQAASVARNVRPSAHCYCAQSVLLEFRNLQARRQACVSACARGKPVRRRRRTQMQNVANLRSADALCEKVGLGGCQRRARGGDRGGGLGRHVARDLRRDARVSTCSSEGALN
jgi:hypothetical protein